MQQRLPQMSSQDRASADGIVDLEHSYQHYTCSHTFVNRNDNVEGYAIR